MNVGNTIKKLRKQKDMTQEQLAEYLNISPQAVSRWEINSTLPDITLIPMLANIFDVSTDTLLGVDIAKKDGRIQKIIDNANQYAYKGHHGQASKILRSGLKEFPNSYKIMSSLMSCVWKYDEENKEEDENLKEAVKIGEKILDECTDDEPRHNAIQILSFTYSWLGEREKAIALAEKMPHTLLSRQNLLANISNNNEQKRDNLFDNIGYLVSDMKHYSPNQPYTVEENIIICKKIIALLNLMFEDENYGFYRQTMAWTYLAIAEYYAQVESHEDVIENLKIAAEHSIINDEEYDSEKEYTNLFFKGKKFGGISHNITENDSMHQLEHMNKSIFDSIRNKAKFIEITENLKKYAKSR